MILADEQVRLSAIEAIAVLAGQIGVDRIPDLDAVTGAIHQAAAERSENEAASDHRQQLRSAAAYAFGVLGGESNLDRLANMCHDAAPNVRYNAATGLARHGDLRCQDVLLDMLTADRQAAPPDETESFGEAWKQQAIMINALRAVEQLARANPQADLDALRRNIDELLPADVNAHLLAEARRTLEFLERTDAK